MKKLLAVILFIVIAIAAGVGAGYYFTAKDATAATISEQEAKDIAFKDAKVAEGDVSLKKVELSRDDGRSVYEIDFRVNNDQTEYDYEIDAVNGKILTVDKDFPDGQSATAVGTADNAKADNNADAGYGAEVTADQAKAIALRDAGIDEASTLFMDVDFDQEGSQSVWSVEFDTDTTEYDYEISAQDGSIVQAQNEPRG
ncbi:MAG: PepSY domain-containing protein [Peptococcaceae bacterium]|nr:PepSY domain-containing protein [Peptococcaceae bacterium]